jgi:hypothetical protein
MEEENALRFQHAKRSVSCLVNQCPFPFGLEGCGKTISAQQNFDSLHVWNKPGLLVIWSVSPIWLLWFLSSLWFIWSIWFVWCNQTNQINQTD